MSACRWGSPRRRGAGAVRGLDRAVMARALDDPDDGLYGGIGVPRERSPPRVGSMVVGRAFRPADGRDPAVRPTNLESSVAKRLRWGDSGTGKAKIAGSEQARDYQMLGLNDTTPGVARGPGSLCTKSAARPPQPSYPKYRPMPTTPPTSHNFERIMSS